MVARVNKDICIHCGGCVGICPVDAISLEEVAIKVDPKRCIDCGICVKTCPVKALRIEK